MKLEPLMDSIVIFKMCKKVFSKHELTTRSQLICLLIFVEAH